MLLSHVGASRGLESSIVPKFWISNPVQGVPGAVPAGRDVTGHPGDVGAGAERGDGGPGPLPLQVRRRRRARPLQRLLPAHDRRAPDLWHIRFVWALMLRLHHCCWYTCSVASLPRTTARMSPLHGSACVLYVWLTQCPVLQPSQTNLTVQVVCQVTSLSHIAGHWLGLDTHDVKGWGVDEPLRPGVALTIEPGLYIPDDPAHGRLAGIGIRIEDDVVVTVRYFALESPAAQSGTQTGGMGCRVLCWDQGCVGNLRW